MRAASLLVAALSVALAGCASMSGSSLNPVNWFGSKAKPLPPLPTIANPIPARVTGQVSVGRASGYIFSPVVVGDAVYAAANDGTVIRLDTASGKQMWRIATGSRLSGGVGADASTVTVGTVEGEVIALEADGKLRWKARVTSEVLTPPLVVGDVVVAHAADNRIFGLDARDGRRRWVYQRAMPALTVRGPTGLAAGRGQVFAGFAGGKLVALVPDSGSVRWEATVSFPRGATELERVTDVVGAPWVAEREVCAAAFQGRVGCFDTANGTPYWTRPMSSSAGLTGDAGLIFVSDEKGAVHALDRSTGTSVWKQDQLAGRALTAPVALGRQVAVADMQGNVHFLSRDTGALVGRVATDGSAIRANPTRVGGSVLVQTQNGNLLTIAAE